MKHLPSCLATLLLSLLVACDAPVKTPSLPPQAEQTPPPATPEPAPAPPATPAPPAPVAAAPEPAPVPPAPEPPLKPILEVREQGNKITLSGHLSSRFQIADIVSGITSNFPDAEIVNNLTADARIEEVRWGNRVNDLLLPLIHHLEDARFYYEDGVTHLEGTATKPGMNAEFQKMTVYVMGDSDARDIKNQIKEPAAKKSTPLKKDKAGPDAPPDPVEPPM